MLKKLNIKHVYIIVVIAALAYGIATEQDFCVLEPCVASAERSEPNASQEQTNAALFQAHKQHRHGVQVQGNGVVVRLLSDDLKGSRHQRFILNVGSNISVLVAHNIDIAPKINRLRVGDKVDFYGEYEWNNKGGVVHWTHRDLRGYHVAGWLRHAQKTYQ